ncbi:MAG: tetratricopeptide repeat protein [Deltaproteobacteria bacterium]|jgi:Tfp pilus assembly protein PilF|nr:tetratricopeptide repeat protein [Deltaproteobacteria bacterium]
MTLKFLSAVTFCLLLAVALLILAPGTAPPLSAQDDARPVAPVAEGSASAAEDSRDAVNASVPERAQEGKPTDATGLGTAGGAESAVSGDDAEAPDAGQASSGTDSDAETLEAGADHDAGQTSAGTGPDAGTAEAGADSDAGQVSAGSDSDAGPPEATGPSANGRPVQDAGDAKPEDGAKPALAVSGASQPADILMAQAEELYRKGLYPSAKDKTKEWAEAAAKEFGPESEKTLAARVAYARVLSKAGYFQEAEAYCRELEPLVVKAGGELSSQLMRLEDILGYSLLYQDKDEEAFAYFTQLETVRKAADAGSHETLLASRARLQSKRAADHDEPSDIQSLRDVLAAQVALAGENDPETLETRLQLATAIYETSVPKADTFDFTEVNALIDAVLKARIGLYGTEHPDVSEAMALAGFVKQLKNELPKAREILEKVMAIEAATLGPDHPWSVNSYLALAWISTREGKPGDARDFYRRAVDSRIRFYGGVENLKSCEARVMLAGVLADGFKDYSGARRELEIAYVWREEHLGTEHSETLRALTEIAGLHEKLGDLEEARTVFDRVLRSRMSTLGPNHPDTIHSGARAAYHEFLEGNLAKARTLYEETLKRSEEALGPDHMETFNSRVSLAMVLNGLGENAEAARLLELSLDGLLRLRGADGPDHLAVKAYLVKVYFDSGDKDKALRNAVEVLDARERTLADGSDEVYASRSQLAELFIDREDFANALPLLEKVVAYQTAKFGVRDRVTMTSRSVMAKAYRSIGDRASAKAAYLALVKDAEAVFGATNPTTVQLRNELAMVF